MAAVPAGAQVKNTFIEVHAPPQVTVPSPLNTAPAMSASTLKASLEAAAYATGPEMQEASSSAPVRSVITRVGRTKPDPLVFMSQSSMMSVPETPAMLSVRRSACGSIPATPAACWSVMPTPTGTPAVTQRTTLPLGDMIQSPTAEAKMAMWSTAYQQIYQMPTVTQSAPHFQPTVLQQPIAYQTLLPQTAPAGQPTVVPAAPPTGNAPVVLSAQALPSLAAPAAPAAAPSGPAGTAPAAAEETPAPAQAAAVALGLVPQQQSLQFPPASQMAMGCIQPHAPGQPVISLPPATMQPAFYQVYQAQPTLAPPLQAAPTIHTSQYAQVLSAPSTRFMPPPPPVAPAPTLLLSPKAAAPPGQPATTSALPTSQMPDSDLKVLIDMAVSSGNQQAVDALLRQAQQSGMPAEHFNAIVEAARSSTL